MYMVLPFMTWQLTFSMWLSCVIYGYNVTKKLIFWLIETLNSTVLNTRFYFLNHIIYYIFFPFSPTSPFPKCSLHLSMSAQIKHYFFFIEIICFFSLQIYSSSLINFFLNGILLLKHVYIFVRYFCYIHAYPRYLAT